MIGNGLGDPRGPSTNASWAKTRPLSDIRELTEPSLAESLPQRLLLPDCLPRSASRTDIARKPSSVASKNRPSIDVRYGENTEPGRKNSLESNGIRSARRGRSSRTPSPQSLADNSISSIYSIPPGNVPPRSSSQVRARSASSRARPFQSVPPPLPITHGMPAAPSLTSVPILPPPPRSAGNTIPRRGQSQSPLRYVAARLDPISHDTHRRIPSKTFIREPFSNELLEFPTHRHPRVHLGLDLSAGIFVGGGSIEGTVQINIDDAERIRHRRTLDIARISIDLLGLEEMTGNRRCVFLNLATELIDEHNPPPQNMVDSREQIGPDNPFWHLMPSISKLPFNLSLPLNVGPPPFQSKIAKIRYVLCVSLLIRDQGRQYIVRTSEDISVLSVYDPEKALMSLPSPLTASDEWIKPRDTTVEAVRVTAGLHRQVWVSGTSIYVDVHIANNSRKTIRKIELQLERDILCYKHAAASTMEKSASQARIFDNNERSILSKSTIKQGTTGWHGVPAHHTHIRTCDLEVPRGHGTVKCGKYFEVRYFLNIIVGSSHASVIAHVCVQWTDQADQLQQTRHSPTANRTHPHDVVPNSVAQVAAAIEEKRTAHTYHSVRSPTRLGRRPSQSVQGRAFAAPRMQSIDRMRTRTDDMLELGQILDHSPRKYSLRRVNSNWDYRTPPSNRKGRIVGDGEAADLQSRLRGVRSNETLASKLGAIPIASQKCSSTQSQPNPNSHRGASSALGFREAEVRDDIELGGLGLATEVLPFQKRLEQSRERQFRFSKKRSMEKWMGVAGAGVGWLMGSGVSGNGQGNGPGGKNERERDGWI